MAETDLSTADILAQLLAQQNPKPGRVPMSGAFGPNGEQVYRQEAEPTEPSMLPAHLRMALENPGRAGMGALQGLLMTSGMSGGPSGAFTQPLARAGRAVMDSPAMQRIAAALGVGSAGTAMLAPSEAGNTAGDKDPRIHDLDMEIAGHRAKLEKMATTNFQSKTARDNASKPYLDAIANAESRKQGILGELDAADAEKAKAATPFRDRHPDLANNLANAGIALAAGIPMAIAGKRNVGSFFPGSPEGLMRGGIATSQAARRGGNAAEAGIADAALSNQLAAQPGLGKELTKAGAAAASGGGLAAEAYMYPDQYDAFSLPEGVQKDKARERALNPSNYLERALIGSLTGLAGYEVGNYLAPYKGGNNALAKALVDNPMATKQAEAAAPGIAKTAAEAGEKLPPGIGRDKNGTPYDLHTGHKVRSRLFKPRGDE